MSKGSINWSISYMQTIISFVRLHEKLVSSLTAFWRETLNRFLPALIFLMWSLSTPSCLSSSFHVYSAAFSSLSSCRRVKCVLFSSLISTRIFWSCQVSSGSPMVRWVSLADAHSLQNQGFRWEWEREEAFCSSDASNNSLEPTRARALEGVNCTLNKKLSSKWQISK